MSKYCFKRIVSMIPTLFVISILLFTLVKLMPGDQVALSMNPNIKAELYEESYEARKKELGLDENIIIQYTSYMNALLHGDLGYSSTYQAPVNEVIARPLIHTLLLNIIVVTLSVSLAIIIGIYCALHKDSLFDRVVDVISTIGVSLPAFFTAILLIYVFALKLRILPIGGMPIHGSLSQWIYHLILPVLSMTILSVASITRYIRAEMIEVFHMDHIKAAKARGISKSSILYRHALKNAMMPIITIVMGELGTLLSGSLLIEILFSWDGLGSVLMEALHMRDAYLIISMNMMYALLYIFSNFLADIAYAIADPRIVLE